MRKSDYDLNGRHKAETAFGQKISSQETSQSLQSQVEELTKKSGRIKC